MAADQSKIIYTLTDEAPALATAAFLPVIQKFTAPAGITIEASDISVAARILGEFADQLPAEQRLPNNLNLLGQLTLKPEANIIKLPNISATVAQLTAAIKELQGKGYKIPDFPEKPETDEQRERTGVMIGSGIGGLKTIYETSQLLIEKGPRRVSPFFIPSSIINLAAGQVSIRFGAKGPNLATCTACTASARGPSPARPRPSPLPSKSTSASWSGRTHATSSGCGRRCTATRGGAGDRS